MKLATIALASALALSSTLALAYTNHPRSGAGTYHGYHGYGHSYARARHYGYGSVHYDRTPGISTSLSGVGSSRRGGN